MAEVFTRLCTIQADTSQIARKPKKGTIGDYYTQEFDIVLLCGLTELQAQLRWFENVRAVKPMLTVSLALLTFG